MDNTNDYTPSLEENLLELTDKEVINEYEATGITKAELYVFELDSDEDISARLILDIHQIAFGELYEWAGKWRRIDITVGLITPPSFDKVPFFMYQFIDNLNYKIKNASTQTEHIECLVYAHHEFIKIHPFNNGNGRTGRILMNIVALKFGYQLLNIYHQKGNERGTYIAAMRAADNGDYSALSNLITEELRTF